MDRRHHLENTYRREDVCECVDKLTKENLGVDFDPELLKAWLTLRFNPSQNRFLRDGGLKRNASRRLVASEFRSKEYSESQEKAVDELRTILFDIMGSAVNDTSKGEKIGVLSSGGIDSTAVIAILCKLGYRP